jgi:hypothetical protein
MYALIANRSASAGSVRIQVLLEDGTVLEQTWAVLVNSRFTVPGGASFPQAVGKRHGGIVESLGVSAARLVVGGRCVRAPVLDAGGERAGARHRLARPGGRPSPSVGPPARVTGGRHGGPAPAAQFTPDSAPRACASRGTPVAPPIAGMVLRAAARGASVLTPPAVPPRFKTACLQPIDGATGAQRALCGSDTTRARPAAGPGRAPRRAAWCAAETDRSWSARLL